MKIADTPFIIFDIETNGLLNTVSRFHCGVIYESKSKRFYRFRPEDFRTFVDRLSGYLADGKTLVIGHNIIGYDIPALNKLLGRAVFPETFHPRIVDTLVLSRLIYSNLKNMGLEHRALRSGALPGKLFGAHSLKAWGYRLGVLKGTYAEDHEDAWAFFNEDMLDYCEQDDRVTLSLFEKMVVKGYSERAIELEHKVAWLLAQMERNGFPFDTEGAKALESQLRRRFEVLEKDLKAMAPPIPDKVFIPKRDNAAKGYKVGVPIQRYKEFNPGSRQQVLWILQNVFNYLPDNPELFEEKEVEEETVSRLKLDDETFAYIAKDTEAPEGLRKLAKELAEYFMLTKRLGQIADGKHGWLKCVTPQGFIHGFVNPNGAVTGRATHSSPNMAQVPSSRAEYGHECRSLFGPNGRITRWVQVGVDASGLELRCLAHFMFPFDGGAYAHDVIEGDIHWTNCQAAGFIEPGTVRDKSDDYHEKVRGLAKTFIYSYLYGAGDELVGKNAGGDAAMGKKLKATFLARTPALKELKDSLAGALGAKFNPKTRRQILERDWLEGLDGRQVHVRSLHSSLNTLLQSAGALICKYWIVRVDELLREAGYKHGWDGDYAYMAWVHDEVQLACRYEIAEEVIELAQKAMRDTQAYFKFRAQLDTEGKIGVNWAECH
ncbi:DNA polymerase [Chromobacterium haemolyticum]|uniref:DNA polymerase n=1 Tax=Chromobacterium TaxID=535 RepID=UPI004057947B